MRRIRPVRSRRPRPLLWGVLALSIILVLAVSSCGQRPATQPGAPPTLAEQAWEAVRPVLVDAAHQVLDALLGWAIGGPSAAAGPGVLGPAPSPSARIARARSRSSPMPVGELQLQQVRRWTRSPRGGHRVRLEAGPAGQLLVTWAEGRGGHFTAVLENSAGQVLDEQAIVLSRGEVVRHYQVQVVDGQMLVRDEQRLELGGQVLGVGGWESYAGVRGAVLAFSTCLARPCASTLFSRALDGTWQGSRFEREIFGLDLAEVSSSTVRIASRENPNGGGWTLRDVDAAELRRGKVVELHERLTWRPPGNTSLEDPRLVQGAEPAMLIGGASVLVGKNAAGLPDWRPSGRVYLAEAGGPLRRVLDASPVLENAEPGGVVHGGVLHVAAEISADSSGVWKWTGRQLELVAAVPGGAPAIAAAEGALWVATSAGLWRAVP